MTCKNIPGAKTRAPSAANPQPRPSAGKRAGASPKTPRGGRKTPYFARRKNAGNPQFCRNFPARASGLARYICGKKLKPARKLSSASRAAPHFRPLATFPPKAACGTAERRKRPAPPVFSPSRSAHKKIRGLPRITRNYMVVGTGFEPVNGKAERIYSPRPLAPWIPYHRVN